MEPALEATAAAATMRSRRPAIWGAVVLLVLVAFLPPPRAVAAPQTEDPASLLARARTLNDQGSYDAALRVLEQIVRKHADSPEGAIARELSAGNAFLRVAPLEQQGPPENRVDVFVLSEGYTRESQDNFDTAAKNTVRIFFKNETLETYRRYFNFHRMNVSSAEDGVDYDRRSYDTAMDGKRTNYAQGQVTVDHGAVHRFLRHAPEAEGLAIVIVKRGNLGTGGGGVAVVGGGPSNTVIHEWGHAFAGLLDEYTTDVGYGGDVRGSANVSARPEPENAPWKHWLDAGARGVGVYEGAAGRLKGAWKSNRGGCAMDSGSDFCRVCREETVLRIYQRVSPIDAREPAADRVTIDARGREDFTVVPLRPDGHDLRVEWTIRKLEVGEKLPAPTSGTGVAARGRAAFRDNTGLEAPKGEALRPRSDTGRDRSTVTLSATKLGPGTFELTARVVDPTPKDDLPWVIRDPRKLLEDRAVWWVEVAAD